MLLIKNSVHRVFRGFDKLWDKNKVEQDEMIYEGNRIPFYGGGLFTGYEIVKEIEKNCYTKVTYLLDAFAAD